ncbi:MAG: hypothetical protein DMG96_37645 [Acidobacteria bacterium]|nr:MAG: hypothetical protein DMG96_37645 [Acidobacteriota bacterium]
MRKCCLLIAVVFFLTTWASAKDQPKFKSIEVKHFPSAEGVELPPDFGDLLYAELKAALQKKGIAEQLVGEDEVVDATDAPKSALLEGSVLEYKKGSVVKESLIGFGAGARSLTAHVKLIRRSNNEAIIDKDLKVRGLARWDPKTLAKFLANSIAGDLKHAE